MAVVLPFPAPDAIRTCREFVYEAQTRAKAAKAAGDDEAYETALSDMRAWDAELHAATVRKLHVDAAAIERRVMARRRARNGEEAVARRTVALLVAVTEPQEAS